MANPEHLALLQKGVNAWNEWQKQNRDVDPDLSGANFAGADLREADLSGADLAEADVSKAKLDKANLSEANLEGTGL